MFNEIIIKIKCVQKTESKLAERWEMVSVLIKCQKYYCLGWLLLLLYESMCKKEEKEKLAIKTFSLIFTY